MRPTFAIASNFQCSGGWLDRLLVAEGDGWRAPRDAELAGLVAEEPRMDGAACLFVIPAHMRASFWAMLSEEAAAGAGDFLAFADELSRFLAFKELSPPDGAMFELLVQDARGEVDAAGLWALVNFGDEPLLLDWPGVRLRIGPGEGCRIDPRVSPAIVPPAEEPNVMVAIRQGSATAERPDGAES